MKDIYIYGLVCPLTNEVRYVGKSTRPKQRLSQHLKHAVDAKVASFKDTWIRSLKELGLVPTLTILEKVVDRTWQEAERYWIARYRRCSPHLTNHADGGDSFLAIDLTNLVATRRMICQAPLEREETELDLEMPRLTHSPYMLPIDGFTCREQYVSAAASRLAFAESVACSYMQVVARFAAPELCMAEERALEPAA